MGSGQMKEKRKGELCHKTTMGTLEQEMDKQINMLDLFEGRGLARHTDPHTSHEAAKAVKVGKLYLSILETLKENMHKAPPGLTPNQVAETTGLPTNSVSPRFRPMHQKGLIERTGELRMNLSRTRGAVWTPTPLGLAVLQHSFGGTLES